MIDILGAAWSRLDYDAVLLIKLAVAVIAGLLLTLDPVVTRASTFVPKTSRDWLLAGLALIAFASWWNLGHFNYPDYVQVHEHYHYYLGSKYFTELGYTRLYQCTAVADVEAGLGKQVADRWIRNLGTNELERGAVTVKDPAACTSHFTAARWQTFTEDVAWFRSHRSPELWNTALSDHGYNATPVWGIAGKLLTGDGVVTDRQIFMLSLIDPLLIVIMWAFVWWAFGARTMCVAVIWWGTNYLSRYFWTGGAFLRADWLACAVIGVCLVKRHRPFAGGAAVTGATLLRIFPATMVAGLAFKVAFDLWRRRSWQLLPEHKAFVAGCAAAAAVLILLSGVVVGRGVQGGLDAWNGFEANSRKHLATPGTNNLGLKTLLSYEWRSRAAVLGPLWLDTPWDTWIAARNRVFDSHKVVYWASIVAFVPLLALAVRDAENWVALIMGVALIPVAAQLTCYYYAFFCLFGLLSTKSRDTGAALCGLAALTIVASAISASDEDTYTIESALVVLYAVAVTIRMIAIGGGTKVLFRQPTQSEIPGVRITAKTVRELGSA